MLITSVGIIYLFIADFTTDTDSFHWLMYASQFTYSQGSYGHRSPNRCQGKMQYNLRFEYDM